VGKPQGKTPLERFRRRWEDNIKIDLKIIVWDGMDLIHLAHNRVKWRALVNTVIYSRIPQTVGKFLSS
jgi:hypothetical protein